MTHINKSNLKITLDLSKQLYILKATDRYIASRGSTTQEKYADKFTGAEAQRKVVSLQLQGLKVEVIPVEAEL